MPRIISLGGGTVTTGGGSAAILAGWGLSGNPSTNSNTNFVGTTDAQDFRIGSSSTIRMTFGYSGRIGVFQGPDTQQWMALSKSVTPASGTLDGALSAILEVNGPNADQAYNALSGVIKSKTLLGETHVTLRNYFQAQAYGAGTVTDAYGARALFAALNNPDASSSSVKVQTAHGLEAYALNVGSSSVIRNAYGIRITGVNATGTDAANAHNAYGLKIDDAITATGGSQNNRYSIYSDAVKVNSFFRGPIQMREAQGIQFFGVNDAAAVSICGASLPSGGYTLILPQAIGTTNQVLSLLNPTTGQLGFATASSGGGGASGALLQGGNTQGTTLVAGTLDAQNFQIITNNTGRAFFQNDGTQSFGYDPSSFVYTFAAMGWKAAIGADNNTPLMNFENLFAYYGNSFNNRVAIQYYYQLQPGETTFLYSGDYTNLDVPTVCATGRVTRAVSVNGRAYTANANGNMATAVGIEAQVTNPNSGIIATAKGLNARSVYATGSDAGREHIAIGVHVAETSVTASGGYQNTAYGLKIDNNITASGTTPQAYAIHSGATAISYLAGPLIVGAPTTAGFTTLLSNGTITFSLNEGSNLLNIHVKYSSGTVKMGTVSLT